MCSFTEVILLLRNPGIQHTIILMWPFSLVNILLIWFNRWWSATITLGLQLKQAKKTSSPAGVLKRFDCLQFYLFLLSFCGQSCLATWLPALKVAGGNEMRSVSEQFPVWVMHGQVTAMSKMKCFLDLSAEWCGLCAHIL